MAIIPMKALLESGVHFGHRTRKWNPKMARYIFTERKGIHIIDLEQTSAMLTKAKEAVRQIIAEGEPADVSISAWADLTPGYHREFVTRAHTFYDTETWLVRGDDLVRIDQRVNKHRREAYIREVVDEATSDGAVDSYGASSSWATIRCRS